MLALKILGKLALGFISGYALILLIQITRGLFLPDVFWLVVLGFWLVGFIVLEVNLLWRKKNPFPRILKHLRYAPIAVLLLFIPITLAFDAAMIRYSKYKIHTYVFSNTPPEQKVKFELHNDYRGWCGNGYPAQEYWLYADTAAEGFSSSDAAVRARSLRASIELYDWLNGVKEGPFPQLIRQAEQDEDALVREITAEFRKSRPRFQP